MEQQEKDIDADNNRCGNHTGGDVHMTLAAIDEEEQRRSGETTPDVHQKSVNFMPPDLIIEKHQSVWYSQFIICFCFFC